MSTLRNRVQLIGHLGADPEMKNLEGGARVATIRIATHENYKTQSGEWKEETQWHSVVAWNQLADRMQQHLSKGSFVMIEGKLVNRNYTDNLGVKKYITEVRAVSMLPLNKKTDSNSSEEPQEDMIHEDDLPF